jgi:hypothetical protein
LAAVAERENGDPTWAPFDGLLTITLARAGTARAASNDGNRVNLARTFKLEAEDRILMNLPQWENKSLWMLRLKLSHMFVRHAMSAAELGVLNYRNGLV